jgi:hypothetical protein
MTGHRMIRVAKECFAIFGGNADCAQTTSKRVAKIMDANQGQSRFAPCLLPTIVVHRVDAPAPKRKTQIG